MLIKQIEAAPQVRVRVGDITMLVYRLEGKSLRVAVDAPPEVEILIDNNEHTGRETRRE